MTVFGRGMWQRWDAAARVVIVAQLFGARYGFREIVEVVRGKGPGIVLRSDRKSVV